MEQVVMPPKICIYGASCCGHTHMHVWQITALTSLTEWDGTFLYTRCSLARFVWSRPSHRTAISSSFIIHTEAAASSSFWSVFWPEVPPSVVGHRSSAIVSLVLHTDGGTLASNPPWDWNQALSFKFACSMMRRMHKPRVRLDNPESLSERRIQPKAEEDCQETHTNVCSKSSRHVLGLFVRNVVSTGVFPRFVRDVFSSRMYPGCSQVMSKTGDSECHRRRNNG